MLESYAKPPLVTRTRADYDGELEPVTTIEATDRGPQDKDQTRSRDFETADFEKPLDIDDELKTGIEPEPELKPTQDMLPEDKATPPKSPQPLIPRPLAE